MKAAGFWVRFLAHILDSILLNVAAFVLEVLLLGAAYLLFSSKLPRPAGEGMLGFVEAFDPIFVQFFNGGIYLVLAFPYFVWGHFRYGTTLGKMPLRIRVVRSSDGGKITLGESIGRFAGYLLSYLPLGAGFLMAAFHPEKRALHELVSGTRSVRVE